MDNHNEILRAIGRIEGKMEGLDQKVTEGFQRINGRLGKHDDAIASLTSNKDQKDGQNKIGVAIWGFISASALIALDHLLFS